MGCCLGRSESSDHHRPSLSLTYDTGNPLTRNLIEASNQDNTSLYAGSSLYSTSRAKSIALVTETDAIILAANYCKERSPFKWCDEALPQIGGRALKWHYLVEGEDKDIDANAGKKANRKKMVPMVMALTYLKGDGSDVVAGTTGFPIPLTNTATLDVFCTLLCRGGGLDHPYLFALEDAAYIRERHTLVATRKWAGDKGSLRDLVYSKQRPKNKFRQKYARGNGRPLALMKIQTYGRHVLEGLKTLNSKGIIADCLTCGNIIIHNNIARISDIENCILGAGASPELIEMLMQIVAVAIDKGTTPCPFDVMLFGLVLLEMSTGAPIIVECFAEEVADQFCERHFPSCSSTADESAIRHIRDILTSIFVSQEATVENLLESDFFASVQLPVASTRIKLSSAEKGLVKSAMKASLDARNKVLTRIQEERTAEENERRQRIRDLEEAALAASSTSGDIRGDSHSRRVQVLKRQSIKMSKKKSSSSIESRNDVELNSNEKANPVILVDESIPQESSDSSHTSGIPTKYEKLLNIGLSQDQVKHKMIQDGFDPSAIGW